MPVKVAAEHEKKDNHQGDDDDETKPKRSWTSTIFGRRKKQLSKWVIMLRSIRDKAGVFDEVTKKLHIVKKKEIEQWLMFWHEIGNAVNTLLQLVIVCSI